MQAQDRYMVFFADKSGSPFSIDNPSAFLSQRAIDRRTRQGLTINSEDLPVVAAYVDALAILGAEPFYRTKWFNAVLVQMDNGLVADVLALDFVDRVEYVAPGATLSDGLPGGDGMAGMSEDVGETDFQNQMLGIDRMHADGYRGEGLLIGVFDEGFNNLTSISAFDHLHSDNRLLYTFDFTHNEANVENTEFNHGTRVLSVLAADAPGEYTGTAPGASYILAITEDQGEYRIEEYNWLFAAEMADSAGVDIINTSLGYNVFTDPSMDYTQAQMDGQTTVITKAANLAAARGILLLTSAGNTGNSLDWSIIRAPADSPNILAVGGLNSIGDRARISSTGPTADGRIKPDVMALGIATAVITTDNAVTFSDGTSFASPLVAGLAAGVWQANPELTAAQMLNLIRQSADNFNSPDNEIGYGTPSYVTAIRIADEIDLPKAAQLTAYPNPIQDDIVTLAFDDAFIGQTVQIEAYNANGVFVNSFELNPSERDNRISINLGPIPAGVYLLRIATPGSITTRRILKY